jgi:RNA polymerase sigma-70 factor (ECF subfamily)
MRRPFEPHGAHHHRLARRAAGGDRGAFVELYRALYPPVARFVACRVGASADTEDVVARTFHRLLESLAGLDAERGTVLAWCLATARNLATDLGRANRLRPDGAAALEAQPDRAVDAQGRLEADERLQALARVLDGLPAETRELIELRFGDGLSHAEIAALTGASEAAVRKRLSRALAALRQALAALDIFPEEVTP